MEFKPEKVMIFFPVAVFFFTSISLYLGIMTAVGCLFLMATYFTREGKL